jgi:pSer/pThr/pTyr-binding forkhead associated (FHA) protein
VTESEDAESNENSHPGPVFDIRRTIVEFPAKDEEPERPEVPQPTSDGKRAAARPASRTGPESTLDAVVCRPTARPPMALLQALDDGGKGGEVIRIRVPTFVIGRAEGDLIIPHDSRISSRHAEIVRMSEGRRFTWHLRDLESLNGTYAKIKRTPLADRDEVLIARQRFRFELAPATQEAQEPAPAADIRETSGWNTSQDTPPPLRFPTLVELLAHGDGRRYPLAENRVWIGSDPRQCSLIPADPTVSLRHAMLYCNSKGQWRIEDADSVNGVWLRTGSIEMKGPTSFILGEQVFVIAFP